MKHQNRRFLKRQEFEILRSSLKIIQKNSLDSIEYEVPFENIHNKKTIQTVTNNNMLFLSFSLLIIGLLFQFASNSRVSTVLFIAAAIFLAIALLTRQKSISIPTYSGQKIELFFTTSNKQNVLEFSNKIIEASNNFLLNKFGKIDRALPIDGQLNNINFLRDRDIISDEEFESLKSQLLGRENKGSLGFSPS